MAKLGMRSLCAVLAVVAVLLGAAGTTRAWGGGREQQGFPSRAMGKSHGPRHDGPRQHVEGMHRMLGGPSFWWVPSEPASSDYGPPQVVIESPPVPLYQPPGPPPPPPEPSYYWYACGHEGSGSSPLGSTPSYCLGGLSPSLAGLPGPGKSMTQFQADEAACQSWASEEAATLLGVPSANGIQNSGLLGAGGAAMGTMQERYDLAYQQCISAKGNLVQRLAGAVPPGYGPRPLPPLH